MSKTLKKLSTLVFFFLVSYLSFWMKPDAVTQQPKRLKIQTNDEQVFEVEWLVAKTSATLKSMIGDIEEQVATIRLPITGQQFDHLLLPVMQQLAHLHIEETCEKELTPQLQQIVESLKTNGKKLNNQELIDFIACSSFLNIPIVKPALKVLAQQILKKDEWLMLEALGHVLIDLWWMHPANEKVLAGLTLQHSEIKGFLEGFDGKLISWSGSKFLHPTKGTIKIWDENNFTVKPTILEQSDVNGVIQGSDGNLISWSESTIKICNKNNLTAEPIILKHSEVLRVIESLDGKKLISWSYVEGTIKIWDKNNFAVAPTTLQHPEVLCVEESVNGDLISWGEDTIKIWNKNHFTTESITLKHLEVLHVIESSDGNLISCSYKEGTIKIWNKNNLTAEHTTLHHTGVSDVIESRNCKNLISGSYVEGTIKIWDKNNLTAKAITLKHSMVCGIKESMYGNLVSWGEDIIKIWNKKNLSAEPIILKHSEVLRVIESLDGKHLISWSYKEGTIKIWDKNNLTAKAITLKHSWVNGVVEILGGKNLISLGGLEGYIKIWDTEFFNPTPNLVQLVLASYFVSKGQAFELTAQELTEFKATFNTLSSSTQHILEEQASDFVAAIQKT